MALLYREPSQDNPKRRIISLVAAFIVVLMIFFHMKQAAQQSQPDNPQTVTPESQRLRFADGDPLLQFEPVAAMENVSEATVSLLAKDDANLAEASDLALIAPAVCEVLDWQAYQASQGKQQTVYSRNQWHWEKLMREPDQWRLTSIHLYGRLMKLQEIDNPGQREGLRKLFRITILDEYTQDYYTVLSPAVAQDARAFEAGVYQGDTVACNAVFLKRYAYVTNNGWKRVPLLAARSVWLAVEPPAGAPLLDQRGDPGPAYQTILPKTTVATLDMDYLRDKMLTPNKDGTLPGSSSVKTFGVDIREMAADLADERLCLSHMFSYAYGFDDTKLHDEAQNPEINYATLMEGNNAPAWMIGKATRVTGIAGSVQTLHFQNAPDGVSRIHLITIGDSHYTDFREFTWIVATLNLPEGLRVGQTIDAEGVFYKLYPYRVSEGWHWSPLLVCKNISARPTVASPFLPQSWTSTQRYIFYGVMIALGVFALGWMYRTVLSDHNQMENMVNRHRKIGLNPKTIKPLRPVHQKKQSAAADSDAGNDPGENEATDTETIQTGSDDLKS